MPASHRPGDNNCSRSFACLLSPKRLCDDDGFYSVLITMQEQVEQQQSNIPSVVTGTLLSPVSGAPSNATFGNVEIYCSYSRVCLRFWRKPTPMKPLLHTMSNQLDRRIE
jgi:hypothetical protein